MPCSGLAGRKGGGISGSILGLAAGPQSQRELIMLYLSSLFIKNHLDIVSARSAKATIKTKLRTDLRQRVENGVFPLGEAENILRTKPLTINTVGHKVARRNDRARGSASVPASEKMTRELSVDDLPRIEPILPRQANSFYGFESGFRQSRGSARFDL